MKSKRNFFILLSILFITGCDNSFFGIRGSGPVVTEQIEIEDIQAVNMAISADVYIIKGEEQFIEIEAQQNIIDNIEKKVKNGKWDIEFDKSVNKHEPINIYISVPYIDNIVLSGSGEIYSEDIFDSDKIELEISGSGDIEISANTLITNILISGSGNVYLSGQTNVQDILISGSGNYEAYNYLSTDCDINISGSGNCKVNVSEHLNVDISGSGNVYYKGNPTIINNISGSGSVINRN